MVRAVVRQQGEWLDSRGLSCRREGFGAITLTPILASLLPFMYASSICLLNPNANRGHAAQLQAPLVAALEKLDPLSALIVTRSPAQAQEAVARLPLKSRVLVVGGNGSVQPLLAEILAGGHTLGLVPYGTGNDLARCLGAHRLRWEAALAQLLQAPASQMDVGRVRLDDGNIRYFASSLSCGFDALAGSQVAALPEFLPGLLRYAVAAVWQFSRLRPHVLEWSCNGAAWHGAEALLASSLNTASYAGGMKIAPQARIDSGQLQFVLAHYSGLLGAVQLFVRLLLGGRHTRSAMVELVNCQVLHLRACGERLPMLLDGEALPLQSQVEVRLLPQALSVLRL